LELSADFNIISIRNDIFGGGNFSFDVPNPSWTEGNNGVVKEA
jgi:hypothetical protein